MNILGKIRRKLTNILIIFFGNIEWVWPKYRLPNIKNINASDNYNFKNPFLISKPYSHSLLETISELGSRIVKDQPFCLIRLGDSEMMFLSGKMVGNIVNRSFLTSDIKKYDLKEYKDKLSKSDYVCIHDNKSMKSLLPKLSLNGLSKNISFENMYQLTSSRILFLLLNGLRVGVIGAEEKVNVIKKLITYSEYKDYIKNCDISEFIGVPQKGASQDNSKTMKLIEDQMQSKIDVYLVGMSVAKILILPELRDKHKCSFIDIGVGIDALAGVIPNSKSFFGNWTNYRMVNYDYSNINFFHQQKQTKIVIENIHELGIKHD